MSQTPPSTHVSGASDRPRRPLIVTFMFGILTFWVILGWLRFYQTLMQRQVILAHLPAGIFWYLLIAGLCWGLAALPGLWGVIRRKVWAPAVLWVAALIYPAIYWIERLLLWRDPTGQRNLPFMLALTAIWMGAVAAGWRSKRVRQYFNNGKQRESDG